MTAPACEVSGSNSVSVEFVADVYLYRSLCVQLPVAYRFTAVYVIFELIYNDRFFLLTVAVVDHIDGLILKQLGFIILFLNIRHYLRADIAGLFFIRFYRIYCACACDQAGA